MLSLRVALAQINPTVGDLEGNRAKILRYMEQAKAAGADLVAFPELALTGYPPEDLLLKPQFIKDNLACLQEIAAASQGITAVVGFVDADDDIYNAAAVLHDGALVYSYHKVFLPNYGVFDEARYFHRGMEQPVFELSGVRVGVSVCEDIWYPAGPAVIQSRAGAQLLVNVNSSPYDTGKRARRERMVATRAVDNEVIVCYVNTVGGQDELVFDGSSFVYDQTGRLVAHAGQFQEELLLADLDVESVFRSRLHDPRRREEPLFPVLSDVPTPEIVLSREPTAIEKPPLTPQIASLLEGPAEAYAALVLGTRDYVGKNRFQKVIIGLSGGIDSSLTATIAVDALGAENVMGVSMPSRFSSPGSRDDARDLAEKLGIAMLTIPIEPAFQAYLQMLEEPFRGTEPNIAEENLQARIRGNLLMALSNKFGYMVLTTGNKSEMATGYATLYGDMAGGLAVLKDVPKTLVYRLSEYRNSLSPVIPESVILKEPSAELRPNQRDVDSLPPYAVLDPILQAYVEEDRSVEEIVALGYPVATVRRVVGMVDRSEYKRRQAPPGVKITPRAFGRDRRLPITNR
ncbi:MAG: NAD+ synthase, partial [Chloroflexota bacterium]